MNAYAYAFENALSYIDPEGLDAWWEDPGQRWRVAGSRVRNPALVNPSLYLLVHCFQKWYDNPVMVTAITPGHIEGPHVTGDAVDIVLPDGAVWTKKSLCCALICEAKYVQDECPHPCAQARGVDFQGQLIEGLGGASGAGWFPNAVCNPCGNFD